MAIVHPDELRIGDRIKFRSISDHDHVTWQGKIVGFFSYNTLLGDLRPYYAEVKKQVPDLKDMELLNYFMLEIAGTTKKRNVVFAKEYIDISTLEKIDVDLVLDIKVALTNKDEIPTILNLLKSNGYLAWND